MAFRIRQLFILFTLCIASIFLSGLSAEHIPDPPGQVCVEDWIDSPKCVQDCIKKGYKKGGTRFQVGPIIRCCCYKNQ
ncbi:hypothetical protein P8452_15677 [Trifolium repens]|nr:hypothetical protein P8452_15677 [Trifolium repens]